MPTTQRTNHDVLALPDLLSLDVEGFFNSYSRLIDSLGRHPDIPPDIPRQDDDPEQQGRAYRDIKITSENPITESVLEKCNPLHSRPFGVQRDLPR